MAASGIRGRAAGATVARQIAERFELPFVDLRQVGVQRAAAETIEARVLVRANAVPYALEGDHLLVAISDPGDVQAVDELRLSTRVDLRFAVAPLEDIELELRNLERQIESTRRAALEEDEEFSFEEDPEQEEDESSGPLVKLVNSLIFQATEEGASDIHLLPQPDGLFVRLRVDGVLRELERIPRHRAAGVLSRLKVLAKLDIAEHRRPQDGRISLRTKSGRQVDIRVAILPSVEGEGAILRLLDKSREAPTMTEIGLSFPMQMALEQVISRSTGALLVTGPTGSGKSTSLYAALADLARPEINVITIEDPVEYRLPGIFQLQVNSKVDFDFAKALRSVLRSDPDVVMVGEIRDRETAQIAVEAALTGHLVLSTLHTNDAPGTISRLMNMGIEPFLVASSVNLICAQRLVRRICTQCKDDHPTPPEAMTNAGFTAEESKTVMPKRGKGCERCNGSGYKGRVGLYEVMEITDELRELILAGASGLELKREAIASGMITLRRSGLLKVMQGVTTMEEVVRETVK